MPKNKPKPSGRTISDLETEIAALKTRLEETDGTKAAAALGDRITKLEEAIAAKKDPDPKPAPKEKTEDDAGDDEDEDEDEALEEDAEDEGDTDVW